MQFVFVCASVVSYVTFILPVFVPHLSTVYVSKKLYFVIVAFPGYLYVLFCFRHRSI